MQALPPQKSSRNRTLRALAAVAAAATLGVAAACSSDAVTSPKAAPLQMTAAQSKLSDIASALGKFLTPSVTLSRTTPLSRAIVKSASIGRNGGEIEIKEAGLKLKIPSGAITGNPITITVTAVAGKLVAYEFQPHGTQFAKALSFEQSLDNTTWDDTKFRGVLLGGYFQTLDQLNMYNGLSLLDELYPIKVDGSKISFDIFHFSGYLVSTGRADTDDQSEF